MLWYVVSWLGTSARVGAVAPVHVALSCLVALNSLCILRSQPLVNV